MPTLEERMAAARAKLSAGNVPSIAGNNAMIANRQQKATGVQAFGQGAADRFLSNVANIPDFAANIAARGANEVAERAQLDIMQPQNYHQGSGDVRDAPIPKPQPMIDVPPIGQDFVPGPTGDDLMGAVQRVGEGAAALRTGNFSQFRPDAAGQQRELTDSLAQQFPVASSLGQISGDVLTLVTGRQPIAAARGRANLVSQNLAKAVEKSSRGVELAPTVMSALKNVTQGSSATRTLLNRAGRAAETGLEGFTLAALNGQADPMETFGYAAGTQAAGSLLLSSMSGLFSGGFEKAGVKLAVSAAAIGAMIQMFKSATPGGEDYILPSMEAGFDKVMLGIAAGTVSGLSGMGRVTKGFPVRAMPDAADVITSMQRGATLSIMTDVLKDPAAESVLQKLATDPEYFDAASRRRLERAFVNEDISLTGVIEDLMTNREFAKKYEAIGQ